MQAKHRVLVTRNTEINLKKVSIVYDFQSTSHKILDGHHEECTTDGTFGIRPFSALLLCRLKSKK